MFKEKGKPRAEWKNQRCLRWGWDSWHWCGMVSMHLIVRMACQQNSVALWGDIPDQWCRGWGAQGGKSEGWLLCDTTDSGHQCEKMSLTECHGEFRCLRWSVHWVLTAAFSSSHEEGATRTVINLFLLDFCALFFFKLSWNPLRNHRHISSSISALAHRMKVAV